VVGESNVFPRVLGEYGERPRKQTNVSPGSSIHTILLLLEELAEKTGFCDVAMQSREHLGGPMQRSEYTSICKKTKTPNPG
jgi:hypothetical protein